MGRSFSLAYLWKYRGRQIRLWQPSLAAFHCRTEEPPCRCQSPCCPSCRGFHSCHPFRCRSPLRQAVRVSPGDLRSLDGSDRLFQLVHSDRQSRPSVLSQAERLPWLAPHSPSYCSFSRLLSDASGRFLLCPPWCLRTPVSRPGASLPAFRSLAQQLSG